MKIRNLLLAGVFTTTSLMASAAWSATDIQWWHAHAARLGEVVNEIADKYNASQSNYNLVTTYKGGYEDTMTAGIAAFRAKQQPNIIQIFDAGAATIINAKGATIPVADLMIKYGAGFDISDYFPQ
jgi:sn-glycerol 3-phosphate transport system substrate-binding protein